ncbi:MAG: FAD-binding oxidoreductase [Hyphomicrobiaceae bacterium]
MAMDGASFSGDRRFSGAVATPYWWEACPRPSLPSHPLPKSVDVVVIGSGYTGLSAAIETARGGRSTLVLEAEAAGIGCSTRNGGQVSTSIKPTFGDLKGRFNEDLAFRIRREGMNALAHVGEVVAREKIDCHFGVTGRFHAAHTPRHFKELADFAENQPKGLEVPIEIVPRAEVRRELASDRYFGGAIMKKHALLDPAKYHQGLLDTAIKAGAGVADGTPVTAIERDSRGFRVLTARGAVAARNVLVATNGYSGPLSPWHRRRVIPIGSYVLATEPLPEDLVRTQIPNDRAVSDTRRVVVYFRRSPDGRRIVFGGRAALGEKNPLKVLPRLHRMMVDIMPDLEGTSVTHCWVGFVAYTFDTLPHIGVNDGIHYAMGYCGSGVSLASYFGTRVGQQILGLKDGATALDGIAFETRPLYYGKPWFLAPSVAYYRTLDRLGR